MKRGSKLTRPLGFRHLEIDEEGIRDAVYRAFTERFGEGFVKRIFIGKYPSSYEVVVYLATSKRLTDILQLTHSLSDEFEAEDLPIAISTRKAS